MNHKYVSGTKAGKQIHIIKNCFWEGLTSSHEHTLCGSLVQQHSEDSSPLSAFIDVVLAVRSLEPRLTLARVAVDVVGARASIPAWFTQTFIGICLTFISMKSR